MFLPALKRWIGFVWIRNKRRRDAAPQRLAGSLTGWMRKSLGWANGSLPAMTLCLCTSSSVSCGRARLNWKPFVRGVMSRHQQTRTSRVIKVAQRGQRHDWGSASQMAAVCLMTMFICNYVCCWFYICLCFLVFLFNSFNKLNEHEMEKWISVVTDT